MNKGTTLLVGSGPERNVNKGVRGKRDSHCASNRILNISTGEALTFTSGNLFQYGTKVSKHVLYSVNMLRNFQRRNCFKEITENSQNVVRPHREVIISVVIGSVGQSS